jgi:hypothetical protein
MEDAPLVGGLRVFAAGEGFAAQGRKAPGIRRTGLGQPFPGQGAQRLAQELTAQVQALVEAAEEVLFRRQARPGLRLFGGQGLEEEMAQRVKAAGPNGGDQRLDAVQKQVPDPKCLGAKWR